MTAASASADYLIKGPERERRHNEIKDMLFRCDQEGLASSKTKRVSVLGTKGTIKREYTRRLIDDFAQGCEVTLVGSAELASLAESALSGHDVSDQDIAAELAPPALSEMARIAPTPWYWPAPTIRCCSTG